LGILALVLVAVGLAMDSFTVAICGGLQMHRVQFRMAVRIAFMFGLFQALMPVLGWLAGTRVIELVAEWDHWVAFGLLAAVGGKMIWEALRGDPECQLVDPRDWRILAALSIATSIDALAVGLSFAVVRQPILTPALLTGVITFGLSLGGVYLGHRFGSLIHQRAQLAGGILLILIGSRILVTHLGLLDALRVAL